MIYIYPSEGGRAYLQQVGPSLTRRDLSHIRIVGTRKARRYAALAAQESTTGQPVPVFSLAISRKRSQPPE